MSQLYYSPLCPESRATLLVIKALNLDVELKTVNKLLKEHQKPPFTNLSPEEIVPVYIEEDFQLSESRAINIYLASVHAQDDTYYPDDIHQRATINRLLFFDMGTLYKRLMEYMDPIIAGEIYKPNLNKLKEIQDAIMLLNTELEDKKFAAGDHITIADHSLVSTVSTVQEIGIDISCYGNVVIWAARCAALMPAYDEVNEIGAKQLGAFFKSKLTKS